MIRVETERAITEYCGATVRESERTHDHKKKLHLHLFLVLMSPSYRYKFILRKMWRNL